ncbi:hypothetical protein AB1E19_015349 [Capra hircus]
MPRWTTPPFHPPLYIFKVMTPDLLDEKQADMLCKGRPEDALEKEMATHSSALAWRIPWTEEPGQLQSMGSQRGRHNRVTHTARLYNSGWRLDARINNLLTR